MSGVAVDNVGMDVCVKFDLSRSNGFPDIQGAEFVWNEQDEAYPDSAKNLKGISPKIIKTIYLEYCNRQLKRINGLGVLFTRISTCSWTMECSGTINVFFVRLGQRRR